jgi:hypothetical protein
MTPRHVQKWVGWYWWQEELDHRVSVRAAKALLSKTDLDADGRAELAGVVKEFYLDVETHLPEERTPAIELYAKEYDHEHKA